MNDYANMSLTQLHNAYTNLRDHAYETGDGSKITEINYLWDLICFKEGM